MKEKEWQKFIRWCLGLFVVTIVLCMCYSFGIIGAGNAGILKEGQSDKALAKESQKKVHGSNTGKDKKANNGSSKNQNSKTEKRIVVIDAGHGGYDEGALADYGNKREKDYTLMVVKELKKLLDNSDVSAYYTRLDDSEIRKKSRTKLANSIKADMLISIHCNYSDSGRNTAQGVESLYSKRKSGKEWLSNKKLASLVAKNLSESTGMKNRGVKQREGLYLMHHSKVPATIIEIGYLNNKSDFKFVKTADGRKRVALGIYNAIEEAYSLKR